MGEILWGGQPSPHGNAQPLRSVYSARKSVGGLFVAWAFLPVLRLPPGGTGSASASVGLIGRRSAA